MKLVDRYRSPPATVVEVPAHGQGAFQIRYPNGTLKRVHGSNLKPFIERDQPVSARPSVSTKPPPTELRRSTRDRRPPSVFDRCVLKPVWK